MSLLYLYYSFFVVLLLPLVVGVRLSRFLEFIFIFLLPLLYLMVVFLLRDPLNSNDFTNYQAIYGNINNFEDVLMGHGELLFYLLMYFGRLFGLGYFSVYSITLIFFGALFLGVLYSSDFPVKHKATILMVIFSSSGFYFLLANAFRQGLSLLMLFAFVFSLSNFRKFLASAAAPALHFSSLLIIGLLLLNKLKSNKYLIVILCVLLMLLAPYFDVLISYRSEKYLEGYVYESSFQSFRLFFDLMCLFFLVYKRSCFSFFWPALLYVCLKLFVYDFAPLIYSRISYYDVVVGVAVYISVRDDYKEKWSLSLFFICISYAFIIFSVDSLSSNFERY